MLWRSRPWKNRKDYIGFLVAGALGAEQDPWAFGDERSVQELVNGYAPHCEWWEITVLLRKTLLMGALVLLPVSYAPPRGESSSAVVVTLWWMSLVIVTVLIMLAALVGHLVMRPYVDSVMNLLEDLADLGPKDRLWCSLELATFASHGHANKLEILPLWLAPWLLCSIVLDLFSASLFEILEHVFPNWSAQECLDMLKPTPVGHYPVLAKFVAYCIIWMLSGVIYLPVSIPSFFSFRMKLRNHQLLLDQMAAFDVRAAKCALPSDRTAIEEQISELFESKVESPFVSSDMNQFAVDDGEVCLQRFNFETVPLDRFNGYVRGHLRALVISQIGDELKVQWHFALIAFLPMILYSSVNMLGCDNGSCEIAAAENGFQSVSSFMMIQIVAWLLCILLAFPLSYPILLRMINCVLSYGDGPLQLAIALLCCPLAYIYNYIWGSFIWASLFCLSQILGSTDLEPVRLSFGMRSSTAR
eukprot:Skav206098  [mRNA]  locus=scaffold2150:323293:335747:- [translate_table: standard]